MMTEEEKRKRIDEIAYYQYQNREYYDDEYFDSLFEDAARYVVQMQEGSPSFLQRNFNLGYNRAGCIMNQLEREEIVSPFNGYKREVLIKTEEELEYQLRHRIKKEYYTFYDENEDAIQNRIQEYIYQEKQEKIEYEKNKIKQKLLENERKKQLHQQALEELIEEGKIFNERKSGEKTREPIPKEVMNQVWNRDGGKCVLCGSQENLEFDHIIPVSKGGATTYRNLQLLCQKCNRTKSDSI